MATPGSPTLEQWRELFRLAIRLKETAPWDWVLETDIFGVQDPQTGNMAFISVMGSEGEHYAVGAYLGPEALGGFWQLQETDDYGPELLLEVPQLQVSFENRGELEKEDHEIIKRLGLKFRGQNSWPMFRSFRPGFFPWFLEAEEGRVLAHVLDQVAEVTLRAREDHSLLKKLDENRYLMRVPRMEGDAILWEDRIVPVPRPEPPKIPFALNKSEIRAVERFRSSSNTVEMDFFMFPAKIGEKGTRPRCAYMLLAVDSHSGMVLANEVLAADPSLLSMWASVPTTFTKFLLQWGTVPERINVRSELLLSLLRPLTSHLKTELLRSPILPSLDQAKESFFRFLRA